ncbi:MAG: hypothetical protein RL514_3999, partial [Verrucomicrobiota bacterium]
MSGQPEDHPSQPPSHPPEGQPFREPADQPFAETDSGYRKHSGAQDRPRDAAALPLRPGQWRRPVKEGYPRSKPRTEPPAEVTPQPEGAPDQHAGKFYEPYAKRPKTPRPSHLDRRDDREPSRPPAGLQSTERPLRIPSSASSRPYDDRRDDRSYDRPRPDNYRRRDDAPDRPGPMRSNQGPAPMSASSGFRRDFDSSARRDAYPPRDARPDYRDDDRRDDDRRDDDRRDDRRPDDRDRPYRQEPPQAPYRPAPYSERRDLPPQRDYRSERPPERREFQGDDRPYRPSSYAPRPDDYRDQRPAPRPPWQDRPRDDSRPAYRADDRPDARPRDDYRAQRPPWQDRPRDD